MFLKFYLLNLIFILIFSTLMVCSSSSWLMAWFGLEINFMVFIPLLILYPSPSSSEASIKYFLTQALASILIIFASVISLKFLTLSNLPSSESIISFALGVKMGMAPTHFWFPQVMELINWIQCAILLTWQKVAPLVLIFSSQHFGVLFFLIFFSSVIGALGGFNISSLKKIMTFSSISHLAWMGTASSISFKSWLIYFSVYALISLSLISLFWSFNFININFINSFFSNDFLKFFFFLNILSLGGMPPMLGILPKIIVINNLSWMELQEMMISVILIISSVITLFFYVKIILLSALINNLPFKTSKHLFKMNSFSSSFLMIVSIGGNFLALPLVLLS